MVGKLISVDELSVRQKKPEYNLNKNREGFFKFFATIKGNRVELSSHSKPGHFGVKCSWFAFAENGSQADSNR